MVSKLRRTTHFCIKLNTQYLHFGFQGHFTKLSNDILLQPLFHMIVSVHVADHEISPVSSPPPINDWKRRGIPISAPSYTKPQPSAPVGQIPVNGILKMKFQFGY